MKKIIISENEKGLLFKNGKFVKLLDAGKYRLFGDSVVERRPMDELYGELLPSGCSLETLLRNKEIARQTTVVDVGEQEIALHFVDGKFAQALKKGKYAFWSVERKHEFQIVSIANLEVGDSVPGYLMEQMDRCLYTKVTVASYQKARLYFNKHFEKVLEPGTYYFWKNGVEVDVGYVDTRLTQMNITGQEILTQDKVSLRINFVCSYRITDYVKVLTEIDDYAEQLHVTAQLAMREYVGKHKLDEILEGKDQVSEHIIARLKEKAPALFVEVLDGGVKDIILPGEIRDIMNTVLAAEKRAQASVITRREEVASTRSLLNTARLMEENQTLYRLKELEYIERICANVGNINLNGTGDMLAQLGDILRSRRTDSVPPAAADTP